MDNIVQDNKRLISGIVKVCSVIRPTYGAAGGNMVLEESVYPGHSVRNDGKAIVDKIKLADPVENIGADIVKEIGDKADKDSGDGRKTTMILAEAILVGSESFKAAYPLDIKKSLDACVPLAMEAINWMKKDIGIDEIKKVATISSENEQIGEIIEKIYKEIGKDGIVEIDTYPLPEMCYEVTEGVRLRGAKMIGVYSKNEIERAVYKDPYVLISKDKISAISQLEPLLKSLSSKGVKELVIYCDDIDAMVIAQLAYGHIQGAFKTLVIKGPTIWGDWVREDFSKITGATVVNSSEGKTFKNVSINDLGRCGQIICNEEETRVIGIKDISEHVKALEEKSKIDDQVKLRLAWLQTKAAVLKVGANSESELSYLIKKAKDACASSYLALKDGVVEGGGVALCNISGHMPNTIGGDIMSKALFAPFSQLTENAGNKQSFLVDGKGYDVKSGKWVDMFEAGIVDPALVLKNAIKNAVSVAGIVLTAKGVITLPKKDV